MTLTLLQNSKPQDTFLLHGRRRQNGARKPEAERRILLVRFCEKIILIFRNKPLKNGGLLIFSLGATMKHKIFRFLSIAAAILIGCGQSNIAKSTEDIVGLTIGMTPEEARLALPKINPKFKINESRDNNNKWGAIVIEAKEPFEHIVLKFTESNPKAWFIGRIVKFQQGKGPTRGDLRNELIAKYGKPSVFYGGSSSDGFTWAWSSNHKQEFGTISACARGPIELGTWAISDAPFLYQQSVSRNCGKLIEANSAAALLGNNNVAGGVTVSIMDPLMAFVGSQASDKCSSRSGKTTNPRG